MSRLQARLTLLGLLVGILVPGSLVRIGTGSGGIITDPHESVRLIVLLADILLMLSIIVGLGAAALFSALGIIYLAEQAFGKES